jgi:Cu(I)/Ag(I) efflux system membrane fusion protein
VETGERLGDRIEILHGLKAGERIVTSGNFLIDSESQLKQPAAAPSPHAGHSGAGEHSHD